MARPLRVDVPGALHHVTARGNVGRRVLVVLTAAFVAAAIAGLFGALITKTAPIT